MKIKIITKKIKAGKKTVIIETDSRKYLKEQIEKWK
jgi:hypothetical protein